MLFVFLPCNSQDTSILKQISEGQQIGKYLVTPVKCYQNGTVIYQFINKTNDDNWFRGVVIGFADGSIYAGNIDKYSNREALLTEIENYNPHSMYYTKSFERLEKYIIDYDKETFDAHLLYGILMHNIDSMDVVINGAPLNSYYVNSPKLLIGNWENKKSQKLVFNADGTASMTLPIILNGFAPQKPVESWKSGGSTHYSYTGGYKFTIQCKLIVKYKWNLSKEGLLNMQKISMTTTNPVITPDTSCPNCYTGDGYDKLWARQVLADYKTNPDVREYQQLFKEEISDVKKEWEENIKSQSYRFDENTLDIENLGLFQRVDKPSLIYHVITNSMDFSTALQELVQLGRKELNARNERRENVLRFMDELVRVSADKSIGFWGAQTVLVVDFDNNASRYLKYIGLDKNDGDFMVNDRYERIKSLLRENVAKILPVEDFRIKVDEVDMTYVYVIKKLKKKQKIAYKIPIFFTANNTLSLTSSFIQIDELSTEEKEDIFR